jgi:DNA-binding MurR/RpiR family transcriptional regulator
MAAHAEALEPVRSAGFRERMGRPLSLLHGAERIVVVRIGPSASLARHTAVLLARVGRRSRCLDAMGITLADQIANRQSPYWIGLVVCVSR